jgi:hypothetical protein
MVLFKVVSFCSGKAVVGMSIAPPQLPAGTVPDPDALFAEARRHRRHRRIAKIAVGCVALAGAGVIVAAAGGGNHGGAHHASARVRHARIVKAAAPTFALPNAVVAWMDYTGQLHFGNVATRSQHVVGHFSSDAGGWFLALQDHLYWLDFRVNRDITPIRDYDRATGDIRYLPRGETVFASADGRYVDVMRSNTTLIEVAANGSGTRRTLDAPPGWSVANYPSPVAVADGGVVVKADFGHEMAIWSTSTGQLKPIGKGSPMIAYTPHSGRYSLLAWSPDGCADQASCMVNITNTATLATVRVVSPLHHGFSEAGPDGVAFSQDGRRLAVFARTAPLSSNTVSELAIINTRAGTLSLVRSVRLHTLEDGDWALWLPGGQRLLAGGARASYAVDVQTLSARPFSFFAPGPGDTTDIDGSSVVLSGSHG